MNQKSTDCIEQISQILFEEIVKREENLTTKISQIDTSLFSLLRAIGLRVMSMLLTWLIAQVTTQANALLGL